MFRMQMLFVLHSEEFCMTEWVIATRPILFFIFEYQKLIFRASVVIQIKNLCFQKLRQNLITTAPIDSMKMLCTPKRLGCWFEFFGRKKGLSYSFYIKLLIKFKTCTS